MTRRGDFSNRPVVNLPILPSVATLLTTRPVVPGKLANNLSSPFNIVSTMPAYNEASFPKTAERYMRVNTVSSLLVENI